MTDGRLKPAFRPLTPCEFVERASVLDCGCPPPLCGAFVLPHRRKAPEDWRTPKAGASHWLPNEFEPGGHRAILQKHDISAPPAAYSLLTDG